MSRAPSRHLARRVGLLILGALIWTLLAMYPDPAVFLRNIARYRHLPLDSGIEKLMGWDLPNDPNGIEFFVDSLIIPTPDWVTYRVPWYVPTAREAATATHGDCETKTMLLASLLEGKQIPYEIRASFTHIWVDYKDRTERPSERRDIAYLEGKQGRLRVHWPSRLLLREFVTLQREQLWTPMPLARKAIWLVGLGWVALAALLLGGPTTRGELTSQWQVSLRPYASRHLWLALAVLAGIIAAPAVWPHREPVRWRLVDLHEALALSLLGGAFLTWLSVVRSRRAVNIEPPGPRLLRFSSFGLWQRSQALDSDSIVRFELAASPGGLRPWVVSAALRTGERLQLLRYSRETAARAALRRLGREFAKPVLVRATGREYWTAADEITLNLRQRAGERPKQEAPARPEDCLFIARAEEGRWTLGYPQQPGAGRALLLLAGIVAAFAAVTTLALVFLSDNMVVRAVWVGAAVLLGMTTYGAMALREEVLAALAGARVEVGEEELSFHDADGKVESVLLDHIESVEIGRKGEVTTIAVVSPERVLHLRLYPQPRHIEWVRSAIEQAVASV